MKGRYLPALLLLAGLAAGAQGGAAEPSYRLPFEYKKSYRCTQGPFSKGSHRRINAWDFGMPIGSKICAVRDGKVTVAYNKMKTNRGGPHYNSMGNHIKIDHGDGSIAIYMHFKPDGVLVEVGETVFQWDVIGLAGNTGNSTGPHLHLQVNLKGKSIPIRFDDVETDGGKVLPGKTYKSGNIPGIPAEVKTKLKRLEISAATALKEGAVFLAYRAYKQIADEKLEVQYPPQEEARKKLKEIEGQAGVLAKKAEDGLEDDLETSVRDLLFAKQAYHGVPGLEAVNKAISAAKKKKGFSGAERGPAVLSPDILNAHKLPELQADWLVAIEKGWEENVLKK